MRQQGKHCRKIETGKKITLAAYILFALEMISLVITVASMRFLPAKILTILIVVLALVGIVQYGLIVSSKKRWNRRIVSLVISIIVLALSIFAYSNVKLFYDYTANSNKGSNTVTTVISVYVRKDAGYKNLQEIADSVFGVRKMADSSTDKAIEKIQVALSHTIKTKYYSELADQVGALKNDAVKAILINEALVDTIIEDIDADFGKWAVALPITLTVENKIDTNTVDVTKGPFVVYLSGLDTRGAIADTGRSDVNMVIVVNPIDKKILMVNIPRDYYVGLYGNKDKMDKLTHAGIYGINCSMDTLEALFNINFNYYVKVNFNSLVNIVDALGGITVDSEFAFSGSRSLSGRTYSFKVGKNTMKGDQALAFARERFSFKDGDRQRGKNQQKMIGTILDKVTSPAILSNFRGVLAAMTKNTKTDISNDEINALIKMELNDMAKWDIQTISVDGTGASRSTYSAGSQLLYVMIPDMNSVETAKATLLKALSVE